MILEILFIFVVFLAVLIVFYRQAIEQYNILQIEGSQLEEFPKLLNEHTPLIVRDIGMPKLLLPEALKTNQRLLHFPIGNQITIEQYLKSPMVRVNLTKKASLLLAKESGLAVWAEHTWFPRFFSYPILQHIHSLKAEVYIGEVGLQKATASVTLLYPTSGALEITLLTEQQEKYLPVSWRGRFPEVFTVQDTPLAGEIKYITIKLRPGTVLAIPTHWLYSIHVVEKDKPAFWGKLSLENPISAISSMMESTVEK
jgi:hypothetical protein